MALIEENVKLDYCDVLIKPKRSTLSSRKDVDVTKTYKLRNSQQTWTGVPIIAANMDCVGTPAMAKALSEFNMLTALHKYFDFKTLEKKFYRDVFFTIGLREMDISFLYDLYKQDDSQIFKINIDVPNGYSEKFADFCAKIRDDFPNAIIMAGNVVTPEMVQELLLKGVDIVKIGIGSGSVCTTRLISGVGYPQLSAVIECAEAAHGMNGHICADGGIVHPGDVAKAFGAGADFVMLGGILAGHEECEGEWEYEYKTQHGWSFIPYIGTDINNVQTRKSHFKFYGMSSATAMEKYHGEVSNYRAAEGKLVRVPYKGFVKDTIQTILGGLRSACTYAGAWRLKDLPKCTTFIRVNRTHNTVYN